MGGQSPSWRDPSEASNGDPIFYGGTQLGPNFCYEGPNRGPKRCPNWGPNCFLRTASNKKSFVRECGVGWGGLSGGVAADVNCDEFHVIWVHNWVPPKQFGSQFGPSKQNWVLLKRALTMTR